MASPGDNPPLPPFSTVFPHFDADPTQLAPDVDPFAINSVTGFLPTQLPLKRLPKQFDALSDVLDQMPITKQDGTAGLLADYKLGPLIDSGAIPDLTDEIDNLVNPATGEWDLRAITAAFRDYSFVASSYLLEPCWEKWSNDHSGGYGLGRKVLPKAIAKPLVKCAEILDIPPFMSYAASYALYNYYLVNPSLGHDDYSNLRLIRAFEHGLDPKSSEAGFILTHIHMVAQTGGLVKGAADLLEAIESAKAHPPSSAAQKSQLNQARASLQQILESMTVIEANMEKMWTNSLPKDYISYRTFIFGITSQSMFPHGVVYEDCFDNAPQYFRGESGANDSIIPLLDNLCQVPMPRNPLTDILREFREYRPKPQRALLTYVLSKSTELETRDFLTTCGDLTLAVLYLRVLEHVRSFRWRHWMFAREYIIKRTKHPTATGGSPIVTWLPNQLRAVMDMMEEVYEQTGLKAALLAESSTHHGTAGNLDAADVKLVKDVMDNVTLQNDRLAKEVKKYCEERGV